MAKQTLWNQVNTVSMYLDRQRIKIIKDIETGEGISMSHLGEDLEHLQTVTPSASKASEILNSKSNEEPMYLPLLIKWLSSLS